jgi:paraquat-inducible protein B
MQRLNKLAKSVDKDLAPQATLAMGEAHKALKAVREAVADDSPLRYDLETMLRELADASRSIRLLAEYLESNPNALIYGKGPQGRK